MTPIPDLLYVALSAVVLPLIDYAVFWPAHRRLSATDPAWARRWLYASAVTHPWTVVAFGAALWMANDRSWASLGFTVPVGWRLWVAVVLTALLVAWLVAGIASVARSAETRASLRRQFESFDSVLPHTRTDACWFGGVSLTAGFCEEFLFRGYFIWALSPWLGWWGAAALSLAIFALGHAYQGWSGVLRTAIMGALFTLVVATLDSLWPAIVLHALLDLGQGAMAWLALREPAQREGAAQPPSAGGTGPSPAPAVASGSGDFDASGNP
jgi:membrane protease YdiL (CAAX protease family)